MNQYNSANLGNQYTRSTLCLPGEFHNQPYNYFPSSTQYATPTNAGCTIDKDSSWAFLDTLNYDDLYTPGSNNPTSGMPPPSFSYGAYPNTESNYSHMPSQIPSSSTPPGGSANYLYTTPSPMSQGYSGDLNHYYNFDAFFKAPSPNTQPSLGNYSGYRNYGRTSTAPPLLPYRSAGEGFATGRNISRGPSHPVTKLYHPYNSRSGLDVEHPAVPPVKVEVPSPGTQISSLVGKASKFKSTAPARVTETPYSRPAKSLESKMLGLPSSLVSSRSYKPNAKRASKPSRFTSNHASELKSITCRLEDCNAPCQGKEDFQKHLQIIHHFHERHDNSYKCATCDKVCSGENGLKAHAVSVHNISQPEILPVTDKILCPWPGCSEVRKESALYRHIMTHAGVTFCCSLCPDRISSSRLNEYSKHFKAAHGDEFAKGNFWYKEEFLSKSNPK